MKKYTKLDQKRIAVIKRIKGIETSIAKSHEYLETGAHANWRGFRPFFYHKMRNGKEVPPHKDWVRNVFLPRNEKMLPKAEDKLDRLN